MPNRVKEKLIELLNNSFSEQYEKRGLLTAPHTATDLIAHGVTVQEWIPVTERLPKDNSNVLGHLKIGEESRIYPAFYAHGVWWDCIFNETTTSSTTHWMPLPQPPKGE